MKEGIEEVIEEGIEDGSGESARRPPRLGIGMGEGWDWEGWDR